MIFAQKLTPMGGMKKNPLIGKPACLLGVWNLLRGWAKVPPHRETRINTGCLGADWGVLPFFDKQKSPMRARACMCAHCGKLLAKNDRNPLTSSGNPHKHWQSPMGG